MKNIRGVKFWSVRNKGVGVFFFFPHCRENNTEQVVNKEGDSGGRKYATVDVSSGVCVCVRVHACAAFLGVQVHCAAPAFHRG